jgi:Trk K+ transport system NAD-binding subunit
MTPDYFELEIDLEDAYALTLALQREEKITLAKLRRSRANKNEILPIVFLLLKRGDEIFLIPNSQMEVKIGDKLLIVAHDEFREDFEYIINNLYELDYVLDKE